jgi:hypothetical protein
MLDYKLSVPTRKLTAAALGAGALVLVSIVCYRLLETPFWNVNGSRLMPSFALAHGVNYYVLLPPGGPLYSTLYGPLVAIVYLPATLFPSPNTAVLAGAVITALLCYCAAAFLHFTPRSPARGPVDILAFLTAGFLICYLEPLKYSCFNIHADGPGLAFSAVACGALYDVRRRRAALPVSAICAIFAILCKQMFLPVPLVLAVYLAFVAGRAAAARYLAWLTAAGVVFGSAALWAWGPANLYHSLIWLPGHHPWGSSALVSTIQAMRGFIRQSLPVLIPLLACAVYVVAGGEFHLASSRSVPLLAVGVALLPFSIAGRAKIGGDINSFSFALFFLTCGLTVLLADSPRRLALPVLIALILPLAISEAPLALDLRARFRQWPQAGQAIAYDYLTQHPGEAYFPWFPIAHFYAEHQFRHYGFGIGDRLLAGEPVSPEEFRAYIPPHPRIVAFAPDGGRNAFGFDLMKYLPDYRCPVTDPELPGFAVLSNICPP